MTDLHTENARLRAALIDVTASLFAAISLLSRGSKKAAPSDKMFDQMVVDYEASAERARAALATPAPDAVQEAARVPEIAALIEAAKALVCHDGWGTVNYTDNGMWFDAETLRAALRALAGETE